MSTGLQTHGTNLHLFAPELLPSQVPATLAPCWLGETWLSAVHLNYQKILPCVSVLHCQFPLRAFLSSNGGTSLPLRNGLKYKGLHVAANCILHASVTLKTSSPAFNLINLICVFISHCGGTLQPPPGWPHCFSWIPAPGTVIGGA